MASGSELRELLTASARRHGMTVIESDSTGWPDVLVVDPSRGLWAVDVASGVLDPSDHGPVVALNRRIAQLRQDVPEVGEVPLARRVLARDVIGDGSEFLLAADDVASDRWLKPYSPEPVVPDALRTLAERLAPAFVFAEVQVRSLADPGAAERAETRLRLDQDQMTIARRDISDVAVLTGPAGSGKTLVLASRARWLAQRHPDWRIQMLCYNRLLVPHLRRLLADAPGVEVQTFGKYASACGHNINLQDESRADSDLAKAVRRGIPQIIDAILIDEWQDFLPAWTRFALATVRRGRGGALLAGDPAQALYRDGDGGPALAGHALEHLRLDIPYRSTRQILRVASALDPTFTVDGIDAAPEGEPVDLIWADNHISQAQAVAADIHHLLTEEKRQPNEIGVLVTFKRGISAVTRALDEWQIPYQVVRSYQPEQYHPAEPLVTVMTVHSAKGHEFGAVFLVGLEGLPTLDGTPENARWGRVGFVGATRARDQLFITYSKDNYYLDRLRALSEDVQRWTWPDDYSEGA